MTDRASVVNRDGLIVGQLATLSRDDYPGMGEWFVQIWRGDILVARVYGQTPDQAREAARSLTDGGQELRMPEGLHPATEKLVMDFACALAEKLHAAEKKYGYSDGWKANDWNDECRAKLREHIEKGDPRDVAAYCAFLWYHGWSTSLNDLSTEPQQQWLIERNRPSPSVPEQSGAGEAEHKNVAPEIIGYLLCGGVSGDEIEDWDINWNNKIAERINIEQNGNGAKLPLILQSEYDSLRSQLEAVRKERGDLKEKQECGDQRGNEKSPGQTGWTCFWCNTNFTDFVKAEMHFGPKHNGQEYPRCVIEEIRDLRDKLKAADQRAQDAVKETRESTEEMADSVRGILQLLRGKSGVTFAEVRQHCEWRGDDMSLWPNWARDVNGYVTEEAAATLIYEVMCAQAIREGK